MGKSNIKPHLHPHRLWILPMVFLFAQQSYALGLGEIQIKSYLGEPLRAQIDLTDLNGDFESSLKVRLANPEEYKKAGYPYPYDKKYRFEVINEDGKHPRVRVSSVHPVDDPFLNLMMEVSSPSGRMVKTYTFLIDPSPDFYRSQAATQNVEQHVAVEPVKPLAEPAKPTLVPPTQAPSVASHDVALAAKVKKRKSPEHPAVQRGRSAKNRSRYLSPLAGGQVSDKLSLSLSTALTISTNDPSLPLSAKDANDALQEELIVKEKTLKELNEQIAEMQTLIKGLQIKLSMSAGSAVAESGVLAESAVLPVSGIEALSAVPSVTQSAVVKVETAVVAPTSQKDEWLVVLKANLDKLLSGLAVIVLGLGGYYWWRKRKLESGWIPGGLFDDLATPSAVEEPVNTPTVAAAPAAVTKVDTPQVATKKLAVGEQSMKVPAFKDQKVPSTLPPEYDLLEEANIYLRFGHDKLAEEVLYDALKINPKNADIYLTLLGIFDTRADAQGFEKLAKEFKVIADAQNWSKVAAMGRVLDIGNALYDKSLD